MSEANDDEIFQRVAKELAANQADPGLWTKSFAMENGDDRKTKAQYIRLRVEQFQREAIEAQRQAQCQTGSPERNELLEQDSCAHRFASQQKEPPISKPDLTNSASIWDRFWARSIDFVLCMIASLLLTLSLASTDNIFINLALAIILPGIVLIAYDAVLTSSFGSTVGKAVFGIKVSPISGGNLPISMAVRRALKVWVRGNGCYLFFPAATIFIWWGAKSHIAINGTAPWDDASGTIVVQKKIGGIRKTFGLLIGIAALVVAIGLASLIKKYNKQQIREMTNETVSQSTASDNEIVALTKRAEAGDAAAQDQLGVKYYAGNGVPQNSSQAFQWFQKAALQGYAVGQYNLGTMYSNGHGVPMDQTEAFKWHLMSAQQGFYASQQAIGERYLYGNGVNRDVTKAFEWLQRAALQGDARAQARLGGLYQFGRGVPQDSTKAFEWYQKAAIQGDQRAQFNLGAMYHQGTGIPNDYALAVEWYKKAAAQGDGNAQNNLGVLYFEGRGVLKDNVLAYAWANLAARDGVEVAVELRTSAEQNMTLNEINEGQRLSASWKLGQLISR